MENTPTNTKESNESVSENPLSITGEGNIEDASSVSSSCTNSNKNSDVNAISSSAAMLSVIKQKRRARAYGTHDTTNVNADGPGADTDADTNTNMDSTPPADGGDNDPDLIGAQEEASDDESIATVDADCNIDMFNVDDLEHVHQEEENHDDADTEHDDEAIQDNDDDSSSATDQSTSKLDANEDEVQDEDATEVEVQVEVQAEVQVEDKDGSEIEEKENDKVEQEDEAVSPSDHDDSDDDDDFDADDDADSTTSATPSTNSTAESTAAPNSPKPTPSEVDATIQSVTDTKKSSTETQVTDQDILDTVDVLFSEADVETMTVKDITRSVKDLFQMKLDSERKGMIKKHLIKLVNQKMEDKDSQSGSDSDGNSDSDGDGASEAMEDDDKSEYSQESEDEESPKETKKIRTKKSISKSRPKRTPKKRKPSHLKIHHESLRKRQIAEVKVRAEEMQQQQKNKLSELDRNRAEAIAKKFQTDSEELRLKRTEDRMGLLKMLEDKRLMLLNVSNGSEKEHDGAHVEGNKDMKSNQENGYSQKNVETIGLETNGIVKDESSYSKLEKKLDSDHDSRNNDSESGSESESDDELEFISAGAAPQNAIHVSVNKQGPVPVRKSSPKSVIAYFSENTKTGGDERNPMAKKKKFANPRAALRNALKAKQFEQGNTWLARELGYGKVEDHIRDCTQREMKKKKQIIEKEQERLKQRIEKMKSTSADANGGNDDNATDELTNNTQEEEIEERTRVNLDQDSEPEEEEDEELALAKELETEEGALGSQGDSEDPETLVNDFTQEPDSTAGTNRIESDKADGSRHEDAEDESSMSMSGNIDGAGETLVDDNTQIYPPSESETVVDMKPNTDAEETKEDSNSNEVDNDNDEGETEFDDSLDVTPDEGNNTEKKSRNSAWKAMLKKEADLLKKQKANRGAKSLLEVEAEEEEEEEGVAGLEDFGFTVQAKKKTDEEDENENADDEDFENIVDEVSDNEGDEEAGDAARTSMMHLEEKQRHKDIMRRMREGYDGKRGGIAGGVGGRGNLRFDQLVAADNKDDAKRLGLLNDDELDSDNEGDNSNKNDDEVEDEMALLDKVLKDRYLNRTDVPEEEFTDSENEEDEIEEDSTLNVDQGEDKEQKNLAKRFARRARMNRLLEIYGDEKEFSQSGLIDQDEDLQKELKSIRTVHNSRATRQSSLSSIGSGGNSSSMSGFGSRSRGDSNLGNSGSKLLSSSSSLSFAINKSRNNSKRKQGFLGSNGNKKSRGFRPKAGGIALGHVVFASDSQSAPLEESVSLPLEKASRIAASKKRSISDTIGKTKSSLWSKVATNGFKKPRGLSAN